MARILRIFRWRAGDVVVVVVVVVGAAYSHVSHAITIIFTITITIIEHGILRLESVFFEETCIS